MIPSPGPYEAKRRIIRDALDAHDGNVTRAAERLGFTLLRALIRKRR